MSDVKNVSAGKPAVGGSISVADVGTSLPTTAVDTLDTAFKKLGYISDEGLRNTNTPSVESIKAWGGDTVLIVQSEKTDTFQFSLLEVLAVDVLKFVHGSSNVTGTLSAGIAINVNSQDIPAQSMVFDMVLTDGVLKRIVIPNGKISEIGEVSYTDSDAIAYDVTITALPDDTGNTHYEYIKAA